MEKAAIKDLIYGGLEEILNNRRYYSYSTASYSWLTDEGKIAVTEFMSLMAYQIRAAEDADLDRRAKQQVMAALKE